MMKLKKIKLENIKTRLKKLPKNLAEKAFLTFLKLFCISLIFGSFIFYQYVILGQKIEPQVTEKPIQFKEKTYESVLRFWQVREETIKEIDSKSYSNPFVK